MIYKISKTVIITVSLLLVGCGSDNAYDGTDLIGGNPSASQIDALSSLQTEVLKKHSNALLESILAMKQTVSSYEENLSQNNIISLQDGFKTMMKEWKSVEASYIASEYNSTMIDIPQYIDYFQTGKSLDVAADIQTALDQSGDIQTALFKNSSKSITALEFLLFGDNTSLNELVALMNQNNKKRISAISIVLNSLQTRASTISEFYLKDNKFTADVVDASNAMVNTLIDSAYKLKEWRIGEPSGIAVKYKDNPDPARLEYVKSRLSLEAIEAILETHKEIMGEQTYANFGSFASENGAQAVVTQIRVQIESALTLITEFEEPLEDMITTTMIDTKIEQLYAMLKELQELYFESLIQALSLTAEIIEADGD